MLRRQAGWLEVCANVTLAKAGIVNILGSLELVASCQPNAATVRYEGGQLKDLLTTRPTIWGWCLMD